MKKYTEFLKEQKLERNEVEVLLEEFKKLDEKEKLEVFEEMKKMLNETEQSEGSENI